jgi:CheY-like chemotaxis protein
VALRQAQRYSLEHQMLRLEERIAHASKTESLAALAGNLAHDFNNLLTAILGNTELALMETASDSPLCYYLDQIDKSARRAAELARQMLAYSGRRVKRSESIAVNLNELIREMAELLRISIPRTCEIRYYYTRPLPVVWGDPNQLRQVVMNLVINAGDALGEEGGTIFLRTGVIEQDDEPTHIVLVVMDAGMGMAPEVRARIFDPFFTTKKAGRGLGLAAVQTIVAAHNGRIEVESELNKGSTFRVFFPVHKATLRTPPPAPAAGDADLRGSGTVLLIDDEESIRETASKVLQKAGYTVLLAQNGNEGMESFRKFGGMIEAVILDINMPGINGYAVLNAIRETRPETRVLIWSGFDPASVKERLGEAGAGVDVIEKPSQIRDLGIALKRLLVPQEHKKQS